jgi:acyl-CoA dehydrogenase
MGGALQKNPEAAMAGAQPYLRLFGLAAGGIYLARGALAVVRESGAGGSATGVDPRIAIARFFAENHAVAATSLKDTITTGGDSTLLLEPEALAG